MAHLRIPLPFSLFFGYNWDMNKKKILFVCTDNFGRSVIAEYCFRDYLQKNHIDDIKVASAGTNASSDTTGFSIKHLDELKKFGIEAKIKRIQLTQELAKEADLIICFDQANQSWIKENLNLDVPLFNQVYKKENTPISCKEYPENLTLDEKMPKIADYIYQATPALWANIKKEYL